MSAGRAVWNEGLLPVVLGVTIAWLVAVSPIGRQLDLWVNDRLAGAVAPRIDTSHALVVAIDDDALAQMNALVGPWPFQRDVWAHVIDYLRTAGAEATVIDVVFAEPRVGDMQLRAALERSPRAVLAGVLGQGPSRAADSTRAPLAAYGWRIPEALPTRRWDAATPPVDELLLPGQVAVATVVPDLDGVVRRLSLFHRIADARLPALPLAALAETAEQVSWHSAGPAGTVAMGDHTFAVGPDGDVELWYPAQPPAIAMVSFGRVARAALTSDPDPELIALIRGRRVFVGATAALLDDAVQTPRGRVAGVVFVAIAESLLRHGGALRPAVWAWDAVLVLLAVVVALRSARWGRRAPGWLILSLPLSWVLLGLAVLALLVTLHQRAPVVLPSMASAGVIGVVGMQEVLRLRRDQQRLEAERVATERAVEQKTRFLNHVAHELRTPVAAILGFSRLLSQEAGPSGESPAHARTIARNAAHMLQLINNLLADARLSIGRARSEPHPASIRQVLRDVVATLDGLPRSPDVALRVDVDPATPDRLLIDDLRVRQILLNLLGNAVKFTQTGRITLTTAWRDGGLVVHVDDTGPGIPAEAHEAIFEEFQIAASAGERAGGAGLGLSVSRRLARLMGGDLTVTSTPGQGSRFTFTMPAPVAAPPAPGQGGPLPDTARVSAAPASASAGQQVEPPLVLVCDDAADIRQLFELVLEQAGARVLTAADGEPAVALALAQRPAVVLLDIDMPALNGVDAFERMRAGGYTGPVVAVTGAGDDRTSAQLLAQGFSDVVHKPMPVSRLVDVVAVHVPGWRADVLSDLDAGQRSG